MDRLRLFFIFLLIPVMFIACGNGSEKQNQQAYKTGLEIGNQAPDFTLANQDGNSITLSQYKGKNVILYFYPKDDTPGCTKEACSFRDDLTSFTDLNSVILGVSIDDSESHKKFVEKYNLNFILLADVDKKVSNLYHALSERGYSKRHTYLIDKNSVIQQVYTKVDVTQHSVEIIDFIKQNM